MSDNQSVTTPDPNEKLYQVILGALKNHCLHNQVYDDLPDTNYPLVDAVTPKGKTIAVGHEELELLADSIVGEMMDAKLCPNPYGVKS